MAAADPFVTKILKLLTPLGPVEARRMFSGHGLYLEGTIFAFIFERTLFLKADETTKRAFEKRGYGPITYEGRRGQEVIFPYWEAPKELLKNGKALCRWARKAYEVGLRAKARNTPDRAKAKAVKSEGDGVSTMRVRHGPRFEPDF